MRYSDDGEPQGTAGQPVLEALRSRGVTDAVLVVTRYFGGILLGASGLTRAYAHSAALGIEQAGIAELVPCYRMRINLPYAAFASFERLLNRFSATSPQCEFAEQITAEFDLPQEGYEDFLKSLAEFVPNNLPEIINEGFIKQNEQ